MSFVLSIHPSIFCSAFPYGPSFVVFIHRSLHCHMLAFQQWALIVSILAGFTITLRLSVLLFLLPLVAALLLLLFGLPGLCWLLKHKASKHNTPPTQSPIRHTCIQHAYIRFNEPPLHLKKKDLHGLLGYKCLFCNFCRKISVKDMSFIEWHDQLRTRRGFLVAVSHFSWV